MPGSCAGSPYSPMLLPCKKNDALLRSTFLGNTQLVSRNLPVTEKKTYEKVLRPSMFVSGIAGEEMEVGVECSPLWLFVSPDCTEFDIWRRKYCG